MRLTQREKQDGRPIGPPASSKRRALFVPTAADSEAMRLRSLTKGADYYRVDLGDSSARILQSPISCQTKPSQWRLTQGDGNWREKRRSLMKKGNE
ncbi:hypothetical protein ElyMa_001199900 [Elysia marginata]|uniref:Uncharacterized protein n=1 Tax=Elysia marginata TaxID=1093978 RepID=A0AAV4I569_9GAST|nr:hypothetical protein ElyMa_001199900 [Elysia marginata]